MVKNRYNSYVKNWRKKNEKKVSVESIEGKILSYLMKKITKKQANSIKGKKDILNKKEE